MRLRREIPFLGSTGCQPVAFGSFAECIFTSGASAIPVGVRGKLPRTTGKLPVLPRIQE